MAAKLRRNTDAVSTIMVTPCHLAPGCNGKHEMRSAAADELSGGEVAIFLCRRRHSAAERPERRTDGQSTASGTAPERLPDVSRGPTGRGERNWRPVYYRQAGIIQQYEYTTEYATRI